METIPTPRVTSLQEVYRRPAYQALEPVERPAWWGVDRDVARRPGVPMMREPAPWPNSRYPIEPMRVPSPVPKHGRPNKPMPPVYGTSVGLKGVSGIIRRIAYRYPDHKPRHWLLKMFADRVDSWGTHLRRYGPLVLPLVVLGFVGKEVRT